MRYILTILVLAGLSFNLSAQSKPVDPSFEDMISNFQLLMDSLDFDQLIDEDLIMEWSETMSDSIMEFKYFENSDSIFGFPFFDNNQVFEFRLDSLFMDSEQMDKLMEKSLRIFEDLDVSKFQDMLEGFDLEHELSPFQTIPKDSIQPGELPLKKI
ncbi:MAG: hypothetical protein KJO50_01600 [Bacteroidia bacterium]|nr:hypothetical protein [Bacteroidia bacterium]